MPTSPISKQVLLSVPSAGAFIAEVSDDLIQLILKLQKTVIAADAFRIEVHCSYGLWTDNLVDDDSLSEIGFTQLYSDIESGCLRVEYGTLFVTKDRFGWTALPKDASEDMLLKTRSVRISFLIDDTDCYVDLS